MSNELNASPEAARLRPVLGPLSAGAIVVGGVIGSGIFFKPQIIATNTGGYVGLILLLWVACGLMNLCGALAMAELSAMMPQAGGTYIYLREAYGRTVSFLWGWAEFWITRSGSIAALAMALARPLSRLLFPNLAASDQRTEQGVAIAAIGLLTAVNVVGARWGGLVQNITTSLKAGFVALLAILPFVALGGEREPLTPFWPEVWTASLVAGMGGALAGIMWAHDGWANVTVVAEEIRDPQRNVPRALVLGMVALILLYLGANLAYHFALPSAEIAANKQFAMAAGERLLGPFGGKLMLAMLMISVFGALNSVILVGPRVLFATARDHEFLAPLRRIDPRFGTPALAIVGVSTWSVILVGAANLSPVSGKPLFDVLTDYAIFGASLFYLAGVAAVFVLRWTRPHAERPYRTWGYPVIPALFVAGYLAFLVSMYVATPWECNQGLALIGIGLVFHGLMEWNSRRRKRAAATG
jgi:basic amino acid/polyamine antiporter, APA family